MQVAVWNICFEAFCKTSFGVGGIFALISSYSGHWTDQQDMEFIIYDGIKKGSLARSDTASPLLMLCEQVLQTRWMTP